MRWRSLGDEGSEAVVSCRQHSGGKAIWEIAEAGGCTPYPGTNGNWCIQLRGPAMNDIPHAAVTFNGVLPSGSLWVLSQ